MKALNKLTLMLALTLSSSLSVLAFDDNDELDKTAENTLINGWGNSALTFVVLKEDYDMEALGFPVANENITSLSTIPNNVIKTHQIASLFENENFSAESGFANKVMAQANEKVFFLQGSYRMLQQEKFSLLLTAKIESLDEQSIYQFYSNDFVYREATSSAVNATKSYARLGIVGQYSINNNWYLMGGVTSTALDNSASNQPEHNKTTEQVALFGTTYIF